MSRVKNARAAVAAAFLAGLGTGALPLLGVEELAAGLPQLRAAAAAAAHLAGATGTTDEKAVLADLAALRSAGPVAHFAGPALTALLAEQAPLYRGRGPREAARLRSAILATLAVIGPPAEALPAILAELAHGHEVAVVAAAARAAGALGPVARPAVPYLLRLLKPNFHDDEVLLAGAGEPPAEPTTAGIEAVRALARLGPAAAPAVAQLRELAAAPAKGEVHDEALRESARAALASLAAKGAAEPCSTTVAAAGHPSLATPFRSPQERAASPLDGFVVTDQEGRRLRLETMRGKPLALTFFYTRCENPEKCPLVLARLAKLQAALRREGLAGAVRLLGMTYDPQIDDALRLRRFVEAQGLALGSDALVLRPQAEDVERLTASLGAAVNFGAGQVNAHGVQLFLFDRSGRYVRHYHSVIWDETEVVSDLRRLAAEPEATARR